MTNDTTVPALPTHVRRARTMSGARRMVFALTACGVGMFAGAATAKTGFVGILGGGPIYKRNLTNIMELKKSGFNELIVWSVEVGSTGDLNLNGEFKLTSAGAYVGNATYPSFPGDLANIKKGAVKRITFSIGSSNYGDFENLKALIDKQGTGPTSIIYKDFAALKAAVPVDAIDLDDENGYDSESTIKFAVMLGNLGYKVTMNPYTNSSYWISVVSQINTQLPGTVDAIHLQTFAGGAGNTPCSGWNFGTVPVYPGLSDQTSAQPYMTPAQAQADLAKLHTQCGVSGAWLWIFDQIAGTKQVKQYGHAMTAGVGGTAK